MHQYTQCSSSECSNTQCTNTPSMNQYLVWSSITWTIPLRILTGSTAVCWDSRCNKLWCSNHKLRWLGIHPVYCAGTTHISPPCVAHYVAMVMTMFYFQAHCLQSLQHFIQNLQTLFIHLSSNHVIVQIYDDLVNIAPCFCKIVNCSVSNKSPAVKCDAVKPVSAKQASSLYNWEWQIQNLQGFENP